MRTQSPDTSPQAERVQIELFRQASISKRFAIMGAWSQLLIEANKESIHRQYPNADEKEIGLIFVARHYGQDVADKLQTIPIREKAAKSSDNSLLSGAIMPVIEALERLDMSYYIGGSVASSIYGIARADFNIDIVADLKLEHVQPLVRSLEADYYIDADTVKDAIRRKSSFSAIHLETMLKVDVFILKSRPFDQEAFRRMRQEKLTEDSSPVSIVSAEDIILNKLEWYRMGGEVSDRQWGDVLGVLKVQGTNLDLAYLRRWAAALNVTDLLERALDDAGLAG
ncbi:MAG TPA: hypothetical protein VNE61_16390 [Ktedonobacteraceae bacterium]|nr:hypothetical protein [Ktedonobacteraceae bacterium]